MIYLFLAPGFEETEAIAPLDIIRRAEIDIATVGIGGKVVIGSHGIPVTADVMCTEIMPDSELEGIILPGGIPGTLNLEKSGTVQKFIDYTIINRKLVAAICAAPSILGHKGLLVNKNVCCFPGFEEQLAGAILCYDPVSVCDNIITSRGVGTAVQFGLAIVGYLKGAAAAKRLGDTIQCVR